MCEFQQKLKFSLFNNGLDLVVDLIALLRPFIKAQLALYLIGVGMQQPEALKGIHRQM